MVSTLTFLNKQWSQGLQIIIQIKSFLISISSVKQHRTILPRFGALWHNREPYADSCLNGYRLLAVDGEHRILRERQLDPSVRGYTDIKQSHSDGGSLFSQQLVSYSADVYTLTRMDKNSDNLRQSEDLNSQVWAQGGFILPNMIPPSFERSTHGMSSSS